jgi:hypothetical protein
MEHPRNAFHPRSAFTAVLFCGMSSKAVERINQKYLLGAEYERRFRQLDVSTSGTGPP